MKPWIDWIRWIGDLLQKLRKATPDCLLSPRNPVSPVLVHEAQPLNFNWHSLAADLANGVWQLRNRMGQSNDEGMPQLGRAINDAQALLDTLARVGVEVFDPLGSPIEARRAFKIVGYRVIPGLTEPRVIETVRPTIYVQSRWVQMAEVKVGLPNRFAARIRRMRPHPATNVTGSSHSP